MAGGSIGLYDYGVAGDGAGVVILEQASRIFRAACHPTSEASLG